MPTAFFAPASGRVTKDSTAEKLVSLELEDGAVYQGYSFGANKSIAGELVFQTGMVGYPESLTDPSYRGQILVITFPLVGNYGVPSRETLDTLLGDLPAHFESSQIHAAGLVTASYSGEDFSHFLAESSLGAWLKEQGVPAMHAVDTRALTKHIRQQGSLLGRMLLEKDSSNAAAQAALTNGAAHGTTNGTTNSTNGVASGDEESVVVNRALLAPYTAQDWKANFETVDWVNPNERNLVAEGESKGEQESRFPFL